MTYNITPENLTPDKMMSLMNDISERAIEILKERGIDAEIKTTHEGGKAIYQNGPPAYALMATATVILQMVANENLPLSMAEWILQKHGDSTAEAELVLIQRVADKK